LPSSGPGAILRAAFGFSHEPASSKTAVMMMQSRSDFRVDEAVDGAYVSAVGEIDMSSGPDFAAALSRMLSMHGKVTVDLSGVTFMDSTGLNVLCAAARVGPVHLRDAPERVRRVVELGGLQGLFVMENGAEGLIRPT
jgi:anti-anti-sigma factor